MKKQVQLSDHFTFRRLLRFTLPSVCMMLFTSMYSIVDGFFVSNLVGKTAFSAVNLIFPVLMILSTVGFIFGTGGSAIVARTFGERKPEKANRYFSLFTYVSIGLGVLLAILGIAFLRPIAGMLGATGELLEDTVLYGRIILLALPFQVVHFLFEAFFVTAERPKLGLVSSLSAGITNILLDALLVVLLPQPYKLAGAAVATALSQVVGGIIPLVYFGRKNSSILRLGKTTYDSKAIWRACVNGSSEFMSNVSMNIVGMLYNLQLLKYAGENGVAAYGVMMYVSFMFSAAFIGYSIGVAPIFGFHHGAQNHKELQNLLKKSLTLICTLSIGMVVSGQLLAAPFARLFVGYDPSLLELTISGFRIFALSFLFMGFAIFASGFFTALSDGVISAIISFLRTLVFEVLAVLFLPEILGVDGIWWSIGVAELMAVIFGIFFMVSKRKKYHY